METRQCKNPKCGKAFEPRSIVHAFCSDECRKALRGSEYRKARELALIRDGYACTECGCADNLECHHITPLCKGGDNSLKNLQTLCRKHHKAKHGTWKEDAQNGASRPREYDYAA